LGYGRNRSARARSFTARGRRRNCAGASLASRRAASQLRAQLARSGTALRPERFLGVAPSGAGQGVARVRSEARSPGKDRRSGGYEVPGADGPCQALRLRAPGREHCLPPVHHPGSRGALCGMAQPALGTRTSHRGSEAVSARPAGDRARRSRQRARRGRDVAQPGHGRGHRPACGSSVARSGAHDGWSRTRKCLVVFAADDLRSHPAVGTNRKGERSC